ncbi:MAG: RNA-binding transcriptional accessory protein, partial [Oscillospiraceae bacterium]|nr:RNA-binding transcriptional accessory protein [Oscillospiraceae bacterium]
MHTLAALLAAELGQKPSHVENVIALLDEGCTVPFIARYRKEMHGTMDDQIIRGISERLAYLRNLDRRREEIRDAVAAQEKLTEELAAKIDGAATLAALEDLYRPFRQKRRTRASAAREKGLQPLADALYAQGRNGDADALAAGFIDPEKGVETAADALAGAADIIAETIADDASVRLGLRRLYERQAVLVSRAAVEEDTVYRQYYDYSEPVSRVQSHRVLAVNRGEREGVLKVSVRVDEGTALQTLRRMTVKPGGFSMSLVAAAAEDAWKRLLEPSMEREMRAALTEKASEQAIRDFSLN